MYRDSAILPRSLYIHWPFCPYRCHYCPFVAFAGHDDFMEEYHHALLKEINAYCDSINNEILTIDTIFFGGGTPSTYPTKLLLDMLSILKQRFKIGTNTEITIEVNPGTVSEQQIFQWSNAGINRIRVGVQSLKDGILHDLNRMQTYQSVVDLFSYASNYIANISIDMIIGLPGVLDDEWKSYIQVLITWPIVHISIYFLTVHEDTQLYFRVNKKNIVLPDDERVVALYHWTVSELIKAGFIHYELSNFGKPNSFGKHNIVYWERKPYKAFGLGACSFDGSRRSQNEKSLVQYLKSSGEKNGPIFFSEILTPHQVYLEKLMLQLRCMWGISCRELYEQIGVEKRFLLEKKIDQLCREGFLIYINQESIRLTVKGLIVENQVVMQLLI